MKSKFTAKAATGQVYTITQRLERASRGLPDFEGNPGPRGGGFIILETTEGYTVNRIEKGKYEIVDLGVTVVSDDPDAP